MLIAMTDFPPPSPNEGYDLKRHNPTVYATRQKELAKKAGCIAAGIGFLASLINTGYVIDGLINGAIWFGIVYGVTRLIQKNKR